MPSPGCPLVQTNADAHVLTMDTMSHVTTPSHSTRVTYFSQSSNSCLGFTAASNGTGQVELLPSDQEMKFGRHFNVQVRYDGGLNSW